MQTLNDRNSISVMKSTQDHDIAPSLIILRFASFIVTNLCTGDGTPSLFKHTITNSSITATFRL